MKIYIKQIVRLKDRQVFENTTKQFWHVYFSSDFKGCIVEELISGQFNQFKVSPFGFMPSSSGAMYFTGGKQIEFLEECLSWMRTLDPMSMKTMLYEHENNTIASLEMKQTPPYVKGITGGNQLLRD